MTLSVFDAAREQPERIALVVTGRPISWSALAAKATRVLRRLRDRGVRAGQERPVALVAPADSASVTLIHALIATAVPVHLLHPRLTGVERRRLLDRVDPAFEIGDRERAELLEGVAGADPGAVGDDAPGGDPGAAIDAPPADERTLAVVYTSGTTGSPKGVILSRRAFAAAAAASAANLGWRDDDRWLLDLPVAHVGGLSIVTRCLLARTTVVLPDRGEEGVARTIATVERDRVTLLSLVPTQLRRLLGARPAWDPPEHVRAILVGGAPAPTPLLEQAADRAWPVLPTYGLTECCSQVATQRPDTNNRGGLGAGPPLPGMQVRIRDGEIQVRSAALFTGYLPPPSDAPFLDDGWFATGDRGELDAEGNLHPRGRLDDVIVSGGENVDPLEVELALESQDGVREACVFGVPDEEWGERVVAAVVPESGASLDESLLLSGLRARLAGFKVPRSISAVAEIPVNRTGKPDRSVLRGWALAAARNLPVDQQP